MTVALWWRDDDAGRDDPRLQALLALAARRRRPVALAVVPAWLEAAAAARIRASPWATVLQHGVAHTDHARRGEKKIELGGNADRAVLADALVEGRRRLEEAFGARFLPVLVPPWNRIAADVAAQLPRLGYRGLSAFDGAAGGGLRRVDTHVDAVAWRGGGRPKDADTLTTEVGRAVASGRFAIVGLLTHHLVMDEAACHDLDRVLRFGQDGVEVTWRPARALFGEP